MLTLTTMVYASPWSTVMRYAKTFSSSAGNIRASASATLTSGKASTLIKNALKGAAKKGYWKYASRAVSALGALYLVYEITDGLWSTITSEIPYSREITHTFEQGTLVFREIGTTHIERETPSTLITRFYCEKIGGTCASPQWSHSVIQMGGSYGTGDYPKVGVYWNGTLVNTWNCVAPGWVAAVYYICPGDTTTEEVWNYSDEDVEDWVESNGGLLTNTSSGGGIHMDLSAYDDLPPDASDFGEGGDINYTTGYTNSDTPGVTEDPDTGENLENQPVVYNTTGTETISMPGQPYGSAPSTDLSEYLPDMLSIGDLVSSFMSNAPFVELYTNFSVTASGSGVVTIPLPEIFGGTATMDFTQYSTVWAIIASIVIAFAYLYAIMIIFIGR